MFVDGTNQQNNATPVSQSQVKHSRDIAHTPKSANKEERLAASTTPQDVVRAAKPLDFFEHIPTEIGTKEGYSDDSIRLEAKGLVSSAFEGLRESLAESRTAEIVDLDTVVNADGLPILPEDERAGALTQEIREAYHVGRSTTEDSAGTRGNVQPFDTLG